MDEGRALKISIVTVVYNNTGVSEALDSILSQRLAPGDELELVIIDGGSKDGTLDVLEAYRSRIKIFVSEPDKGIYDAMNKGLALVTGDIVGTLNSDDVYEHDRVLAHVGCAFRETGAEISYGDLVYVRKDDPGRVVRYWRSGAFRPGRFQAGWMPAHPTFFVRKEVYERYGTFNSELRLAADFELTMRLIECKRVSWTYIPEIMVRMRMGGATNRSIRNVLAGNLESYHACRINNLKVFLPWFVARKVLSRIPQFFQSPPR